MNKKVLKFVLVAAIASHNHTLLAESSSQPNGPIPYSVTADDLIKNYHCRPLRAPADLCTPNHLKESAHRILFNAVQELYNRIQKNENIEGTSRCLKNLERAEPKSTIYTKLKDFLLRPRAKIILPAFNVEADQVPEFEDAVTFSYADVISFENPRVRTPAIIGVNATMLDSLHPSIGTNISFWATMIALGIYKNLGLLEGVSAEAHSIVNRAAQCIHFDGKPAKAFQILEPIPVRRIKK